MVGHSWTFGSPSLLPPPAESLLKKAMEFDDSLFVTEEQNLFIDELRETRRWCGVFETLQYSETEDSVKRLTDWVEGGLRYLIELTHRDDGVLGWTSDQHVFTLCVRIVLCARTIRTGSDPKIADLLEQFRYSAENARMHGFLLALSR